MKKHTTFRIGGPARYFIVPASVETFIKIYQFCHDIGIPVFVLGNGSNLLVSDEGINGAVLCMKKLGRITADGQKIVCEAGAALADACRFAQNAGLAGLEFAFGIPGTVGGAVYMNAGAYGGEMKDTVISACHIDTEGAGEYTGAELSFGYRRSAYTGTDKAIVNVTFRLDAGDREEIGRKMAELLERRKQKQPLEYPSAGSVFKRPAGHYAGTLIEGCGLKGMRTGGAMVSEKHAGFIVNAGGATCSDVLKLIDKIKNEVFTQTGVELECEIRKIGV